MGVYQRGANWYIDFTFHGKRIRQMVGSRRVAKAVQAKKEAEIAENKFLDKRKDPEPMKFHDFAKEYVKWSIENKKPSAKTRELSLMRSLDKEFGEKFLHDISSFDVEAWKMKRKKASRQKAKEKRGIKPATVNRELAVLKTFFSKAVEWGRCKENPAKKVKLFKGVSQRLRYLTPDEVQTLILNCADHIRPIVTVAVHTGMRKGEVLGLRRDQVDFERGIITLTDTKNSERRDIPMNETVKATLKAIGGDDPLFFASTKKKGSPFVWIEMSFHQALEKSGIKDFKFHDLRHTFASNLVMNGEDLYTVSELLGHKSPEMTRRYAHLSPKFKKRAVNILDTLMSQNQQQDEKEERKVLEFKR